MGLQTGERKDNTSRTIAAKLSSYKTKELILKNVRKLKDTGYYKNEDFSKETVEIRKENWTKIKELRKNGKYATLVYDKVFWRERDLQKTLLKFVLIFRKNFFFVKNFILGRK